MLGFNLGVMVCLIAVLIYVLVTNKTANEQAFEVFRRFRAGFYVWIFAFLMGMDVWFFRKAGVNYVLIFEIDPRNHLSHQHIFSISAVLACSWLIAFITELCLSQFSRGWSPVALYLVYLLYLVNPFYFFHWKARKWLFHRVGRAWTFGVLGPVIFTDFWFADQFNSLSSFFVDMNNMFCLVSTDLMSWSESVERNNTGLFMQEFTDRCYWPNYGIGVFIAMLPPLMRLGQCIRRYIESNAEFVEAKSKDPNTTMRYRGQHHLNNAMKYRVVL